MKILNLGAGNKPVEGAINHDRALDAARPWVTVAHDLNVLPWPWADESCEEIVARAVLEHLNIDLVQSMDECWRILRAGGMLDIKLPFWQSEASYEDPTHRWRYTLSSLDIFDPATEKGKAYRFYTARKWEIVRPPRLNRGKSSIYALLKVRK